MQFLRIEVAGRKKRMHELLYPEAPGLGLMDNAPGDSYHTRNVFFDGTLGDQTVSFRHDLQSILRRCVDHIC